MLPVLHSLFPTTFNSTNVNKITVLDTRLNKTQAKRFVREYAAKRNLNPVLKRDENNNVVAYLLPSQEIH